MLAAQKGQADVCVKLAELGADLNKADQVSETCCNCIIVCYCIIVIHYHAYIALLVAVV